MAFTHGIKPIVNNGLILALDAGNPRSYPGSGTTWYDLVLPTYNGTLTNGPTFSTSGGGSIVFDGSNDHVSTALTSTTSFTWDAWFNTDVVSSGFKNIISIPTPNYMLMLLDDNTSNMGFWSSDGLGGVSLGMDSISTGTWFNAVFVREGNSTTNGYKTYLNGTFKGQANTGVWSSSAVIWIGGRSDTSQYYDGKIAQIKIYNRPLSSTEILQNYNLTKSKFGL